jgi:hypothetical protein
MFHLVEFVADRWVGLEHPKGKPLQQVLMRRGTRRKAEIRPRVIEHPKMGLIESADLLFEDGTSARNVPFGCFMFAESA